MEVNTIHLVTPKPLKERPQPQIEIIKNLSLEKWHLLVIVHNFKGGTHEGHDVVFNSDCNEQHFDSPLDAALHANNLLAKHKHDNELQYQGISL